ncbi:MAG: hypothetical protein ACREF5_00750 [Candidatus Saccharimonadales bacterium]
MSNNYISIKINRIRESRASFGRRILLFAATVLLLTLSVPYILQPNASVNASTDSYCIDFRSTVSYVTDPAGCTYSIGGQYPQTRDGLTFGWLASGVGTRNRSTSTDPRVAGINFAGSTNPETFEITLPSTGLYDVGVAMGDAGSGQNAQYVEILDDTTSLISMTSGNLSPGEYYDLAGNLHTSAADFFANQTLEPLTFNTTTMYVVIGKNGVGTNHTIANLELNKLPSSGPLKSPDYEFEETALGGIGITNTQSADYQAAESGAMLGFGNSADSTLQINNGHTTTSDPALSFAVNSFGVNLGNFSPSATAVATTTFQVSDYTSYGYIVQLIGTPPSYGSHTIATMATTEPSVVGEEQFGINLVANTLPVSLGANPGHGLLGVGSAASNYGTANNYRFTSGDTVASAPESSGVTIYTISYIVNVSSLTPAGQYNASQTLICTGTY